MRLLSCYIEGYGKIKQREFFFDEGLTAFLWENGEGKSTLASFLKAMLYGLKGYRKGAVEFCDREHFYPFDGGRFGGNLRIEADGKEYKIERFFDEKSEKGDTLKVYEEGAIMKTLPEDLGKYLIGVDRESFERTLFLRHEDLEISSTSGIHAKLNQLLEGGAEEGGLDEALERLDKASKVYKKRGGGDRITATQERIKTLKAHIENAATLKGALEEKYLCAEQLREKMQGLQREITKGQKAREIASQKEHYDSLLEGAKKAEEGLSALAEKYPAGLPSFNECRELNAYLLSSNQMQMKIDGAALTKEERENFTLLSARFQEGIPTEGELAKTEEKIEEYKRLQLQAQDLILRQGQENEEKFSRQKPSAEDLENAERKLGAYKEKMRALQNTPAFSQKGNVNAPTKGYLLAALAFVLLALIGTGALLIKHILLGGALALVGGIGLLAVGFLYLNKKSSAQGALVENFDRLKIEREARELERDLQSLLLPLGYAEENVEVAFAALKRDLQEYENKIAAKQTDARLLTQNQEKRERLIEELSAFFHCFGEGEDDFSARLSRLKEGLVRWQTLSIRKESSEKICREARKTQAELKEKIGAFERKYRLQAVDVDGLIEDARSKEILMQTLAESQEKALVFKREKGLQEETQPLVDVEALQAEYARLQGELAKTEREIGEDERNAELLESYESEKDEAEGLLKEYKRKYALLTATSTLLSGAAGKLRDKYVKPVKDEFLRYAKVLEEALGERVVMTKNFELRFERNGVERSEKHLSSGQRSICALCFRLALIKNMYEGKLPFLVLDDPFTTLDETHLARVKKVLKALSGDMQTIYLTCHSSRMV